MLIKNTLTKGLQRHFDVTIEAHDIETDLDRRLESLGKTVKIAGFRPGKIPLFILKQRYKDSAFKDILEGYREQSVKQIVKDIGLQPALKPRVTIKSYEEGKDLVLSVEGEFLPVLGDLTFDDLSLERYVVDVPSSQVDETLENLAKQNPERRPVKKARKTEKGDLVVIDFKGFINEKSIEGGTGVNYSLELGSGAFIPGFEDQLIGHSKGDKVDVNVVFPEDYPQKPYAGKPAHFEVILKDIQELHTPLKDDVFAKRLGVESLKDLKEAIQKNLSGEYERQSFLNVKRQVFDFLSEKIKCESPPTMVALEFRNIWAQLLQEAGISEDQSANKNGPTFKEATGKTEEELRQDYQMLAERRVRLGIIIGEIANRENIRVSQQELMQAVMAKAREFPGQEKKFIDFYRDTPSALETLRAPLFEDKVVEFILTRCKVKDISTTPEKLQKILLKEEEEAEKRISSSAKKKKKGGRDGNTDE